MALGGSVVLPLAALAVTAVVVLCDGVVTASEATVPEAPARDNSNRREGVMARKRALAAVVRTVVTDPVVVTARVRTKAMP